MGPASTLLIGASIILASAQLAGALPSDPVAWGPEAVISPGGWGRMARLPDGSWLAVVTTVPPDQPSSLKILKSADECKSWSPSGELAESGRKLDNGILMVASGELLLAARSVIDGQSYRLPIYRSPDGGRTWARIGAIASSEGAPGTMNGKGLGEPFLLPLGGRKLAAFYADETQKGFSQVIAEKVSTDGGATWGREIIAAAPPTAGGPLRPGVPVAARLADGRMVLVYEVVGIGNGDVHRKLSRDGLSWEKGLGARIPCQRKAPFIIAASDGRLLLSSCSNQVSCSEDGGESWLKLDQRAWEIAAPQSWPALYEVSSGRLAVVSNVIDGVRVRFGDLRPVAWLDSFREDFEVDTASGWTVYLGSGGVDGGTYRMGASRGDAMALTGSPQWTDGLLEADVDIESGPSAGLVFRVLNAGDEGGNNFFGYFAGVDPAGKLNLGRMDGNWKMLAEVRAPVLKGRRNHLQVRMAGPSIRVYLDDPAKPKLTINDPTYRRGQVGMRVFNGSARFDNVSFQGEGRASKGAAPKPAKKS